MQKSKIPQKFISAGPARPAERKTTAQGLILGDMGKTQHESGQGRKNPWGVTAP
jgi:hypothetical protein